LNEAGFCSTCKAKPDTQNPKDFFMRYLFSAFLFVFLQIVQAQVRPLPASEILQAIRKFSVTGSVLYIAAHPDDENTRLITWLSQEKKVRTGYLSLTRGDGGQNLLGTETAESLGVIRTQELLEARKRDGGEQFFTRAVDFGFSKSFDETLNFWDRGKVLSDVVWVIRKFHPDVIITRFPPDSRAGHGHHSSSAIIATEAFAKAADPKAFPEQLKFVKTWQAKRVYFNTATFFMKQEEMETSEMKLDVGAYNALLGKSVNEVAAESRSQHKSQGFGVPLARGSQMEYFQFVTGEKATPNDLLSGIDLTWNRFPKGENIARQIADVEQHFEVGSPEKSLPALSELYKNLQTDFSAETEKLKALQKIILACAGVYAEAVAEDFTAVAGENVNVKINLINRSDFGLKINSLAIRQAENKPEQVLANNKIYTFPLSVSTAGMEVSQAYWLKKPYKTLYSVDSQELISLPENPPALSAVCKIGLPNDITFDLNLPVQYKWTDRVEGEQFRPFLITPAVSASLSNGVFVFRDEMPKTVSLTLLSHKANLKGSVKLALPAGWRSEPASVSFDIPLKNQEQQADFQVFPPKNTAEATLQVVFQENGRAEEKALSWQLIAYPHITRQTLMPVCEGKLVKMDLKIAGKRLGYVMGAGDKVPESLQQIGYEVVNLPADQLLTTDLSRFDAILTGIRAYNTEKGLVSGNPALLKYVENGGKLIVQYNTNGDMVLPQIAPYPLTFSRFRVTEENASVTFADKTHPILNSPNLLTARDFEGWTQERGLYFASEWDSHFTPILAWNDKGEAVQQGGLLAAKYGKGSYIYTGISFFRQLPAGVPGAYRLLANMLAW
jgi:LmbE family N-acetylglucosaminyl deacetylase